jgi:hypothetical protein
MYPVQGPAQLSVPGPFACCGDDNPKRARDFLGCLGVFPIEKKGPANSNRRCGGEKNFAKRQAPAQSAKNFQIQM